jgi:F-type H+-transporting ATPase subunit b
MHFDWWTFALQTINFVILVWLLNRFLYRPVLRLIDARRQEVDKQFAAAKSAEQEAFAKLKEIENQRAEIDAQREQTAKAAAQQAAEAARTRAAQAEAQADALMEETRRTLAREREQTKAELHQFALDMAADMARKLVSELPAEKRAEAWLERIDGYFANLPPEERKALIGQAANGAPIGVTSAVPLPPDAAEAWRKRLRQVLGEKAVVTFAVDPQLIAGVELHFPEAILRFSLQDAISRLHSEVEARGKAAQ